MASPALRRLAGNVLLLWILAEEDEAMLYLWQRRKRRARVRDWSRRRENEMARLNAQRLQSELIECDVDEIGRLLHMTPETYGFILERIKPHIRRRDTTFSTAITPSERLTITLKYLATGESTLSLSYRYRVGRCTVGRIVKNTCQAIFSEFGPDFIKLPTTQEEWCEIEAAFSERWNYPGCIGVMDGMHARIALPKNTGCLFQNYKNFFSIILLACFNANYEFIYIDVGSEGSLYGDVVWTNCSLNQALKTNEVNIPPPLTIQGCELRVPHHFVSDDSFQMGERFLKQYGRRHLTKNETIFNYRLGRVRSISANVFGLLANRFRVLHTEITMNPDDATKIVLCTVTLHNLLSKMCPDMYMPEGSVDREDGDHNVVGGAWRREPPLTLLQSTRSRNATNDSKNVRDSLASYFNSPSGSVPWQDEHASDMR